MTSRLLMLALALSLCWPLGARAADQPSEEGTAENWLGHDGGPDESAYSRLQQVNTTNIINKLGLAWYLDLPDERMLEGTPLAVDGVIYFTGSYSKAYAVDAVTGKLLWTYDPEVWRRNPNKFKVALPVNRGPSYEDGRVFVSTLDGRLIALDAKTGKPLWTAETVPLQSNLTITGAPRVLRGKVLIGNGGGDGGAQGYLSAYDAVTGRKLWQFTTVPTSDNAKDPGMAAALASWGGAKSAGGSPWEGITVDPGLNRVYIGTGNPSPNDPSKRGVTGDDLYTASIVALDADTGKYVWHYQVNPRDAWDFDFAEQMVLADLTIDGQTRHVLMQAPKNGFFYVIDRTTGKLISAEKIGKANWAERIDLKTGRPIDTPNNRYENGPIDLWPTALGAHAWQTMAFSPQAGLVFVPYMQVGVHYDKSVGEELYGGLAIQVVKKDAEDNKGRLIAWDPVAQKARWTIHHDYLFNGGTMATAGGLVFQGDADGFFTAYDAASGARLWRFNTGLGIISAPISFAANGRQYISVLVGYGATNVMGVMNAGWKFGAQPRRLLTFALDGTVTLPPGAPQDFAVHAVDDPAQKLDQASVRQGEGLFTVHCGGCHGLNAVSAGPPGPDLRESQIVLSRDSFWNVVHDGALVSAGMPPFPELDATQIGAINSFIRAKAREALANAKTDPPVAVKSP